MNKLEKMVLDGLRLFYAAKHVVEEAKEGKISYPDDPETDKKFMDFVAQVNQYQALLDKDLEKMFKFSVPPANRSCRDCAYLDVQLNKKGQRILNKQSGYRCLYPMDQVEWPDLPDSVTTYTVNGLDLSYMRTDRCKRYMSPGDGDTCPTWKALDMKQPDKREKTYD